MDGDVHHRARTMQTITREELRNRCKNRQEKQRSAELDRLVAEIFDAAVAYADTTPTTYYKQNYNDHRQVFIMENRMEFLARLQARFVNCTVSTLPLGAALTVVVDWS